jgi:hypothetical protein
MNANTTPPGPQASARRATRPLGVVATIGVRVSARLYATLREKAAQLSMTPAQWLREAALSRPLPSPTGIDKLLVSRMDAGLDWSFVSSDTNSNTNRFSPYGLVSASGRPLRLNWSDRKFLADLHFCSAKLSRSSVQSALGLRHSSSCGLRK